MKTKYTKYLVAFDQGNRNVQIQLEGFKPTTGHRTIGEFEANVVEGVVKGQKDFETNGDHLLVAAARKVLTDLEIVDQSSFVFEDLASQAPTHGDYTGTVAEIAKANSVDGDSGVEYQERVSKNLDKAEAPYLKADKKSGNHAAESKPKD